MRRFAIVSAAIALLVWPIAILADSASTVCNQYQNDCPASATSTVLIGVGDTTLHITGFASPAAFVIIQLDGATVGSMSADGTGHFETMLVSRPYGLHNISVFAKDVRGTQTATITRQINITEHFQTDLNVILPPSYTIVRDVVVQCQQLVLTGYTVPGAKVQINNDYGYMATVTANPDGNWFYKINTANLRRGYGRAYVFAVLPNGQATPFSPWRVWRVKANPGACNPLPTSGSIGGGGVAPVVVPRAGGGSLPGDNQPVVVNPSTPPPAAPFLFKANDLRTGQLVNLAPSGRFAASFTIEGANPFWITVDWGDGITEVINIDNNHLDLNHHYQNSGSYKLTILGADTLGRQAIIPFTIKVNTVSESAIRLLSLAYFAYGLIVIGEYTMRRLLHRGWA